MVSEYIAISLLPQCSINSSIPFFPTSAMPSRIFLFDSPAINFVRGPAARRAPSPPAASRGNLVAAAPHANAEQDRRDQQRDPCAPAEAEGVAAQIGRLVVREEGVARFDEGGTIVRN
jgi:hypothetical protein